MKKLFILISFSLLSCLSELPTVQDFYINLESIDLRTTQLEDSIKLKMNGIYEVRVGKDLFGNNLVGKWINNRWCLYSIHDVVYSENKGGLYEEDSSFKFIGYIRIVRSGSGTQTELNIHPSNGAIELLSGYTPSSIVIKGNTSTGSKIEIHRTRDLYPQTDTTRRLHIIGHRGGGRNAERLGISENSIEMIKHSEILGVTGVEIDVKKTRDGKIILFHDDTFSPRTVQGTYLLGKVENFDLDHIRTFGRLYYGEEIPTLENALTVAIEETTLELVWIDVKDPEIVDKVMVLQKAAIDLASEKNKNIDILVGISEEEIFNAYNRSILEKTPTIIEYDSQLALSQEFCKVWAPRWTNGIPSPGEVESFHSNNKMVFTWTLDVKRFIEDFIQKSKIDGILSNYPSQVAGIYYSQIKE